MTIHNNITIGQGKPTPGAGGTFGVIQQTAAGGDATIVGSVTILKNNSDGGLFNGPAAGGTDFLNINGPVIAGGTADTIIQIGGNVKYGDTTGTSSYPRIQMNGQGDLGTNNALCQTAVLQLANFFPGTFDLNGFNQTTASLLATTGNAAIVQNSGATASTLTLNTTTANDTANNNTYNGAISGNVNLTVGGSGTEKLTATNSNYTGVTTLTGSGTLEATLIADGNGTISSIGAPATSDPSLLVFDGGRLRYMGVEATVSTNRGFTINNGKTAIIDVNNAATNLVLNGNSATSGGTTGGFTKAGAGTLTLAAGTTHAYTGTTTVSNGILVVNTNLTNTSAISIASTGKLSGIGSIGGSLTHTAGLINPGDPAANSGIGTLTFTGPLALNNGGLQYDIDGSSFSNPQDLIQANGGLTIPGVSNVELDFLNPATPPSSPFDIVLFKYTGTLLTTAQANNLQYTTNIAGRTVFTTNLMTVGGVQEVVVHAVPGVSANLSWNSTSSGAWDTTSSNWFNTGTSADSKFANGDTVTFGDTTNPVGGSLQTAITISGTVNPATATFSSNSKNYTISVPAKSAAPAT